MSIGSIKIHSQPSNSSPASSAISIVNYSSAQTMASQSGHTSGTATSQNAQGVNQQLQLQQTTATTTMQGGQPLQVIQQPLQNPTLMPHQYFNTAQGQLLMPNLTFHPGLNPQIQQQITPQIQVIAAGKSLQPNQISTPHMFTTATSYTIPTSASNNQQAYIIGSLNSHPSILQQQQNTGKPGEMQKVIQPQLGAATAQLPQMWAIPQFLNQSSILIRGTQPDQGQMFIQQPTQQIQNSTGTHPHFTTMPLTTGQLPSTSTNGVQSVNNQQTSQGQQSQQSQSQITTSTNNFSVSIKPQTLQPKPPMQIQPANQANQNQNQQNQSQQQNQNHQQQMQQQHLSQLQQVMSHPQVQMIPQGANTSQPNMISLAQTAQVMQQAQSIQPSRQLTILPQGATQPQPVTLQLQQQPVSQHQSQPQPIRPNYSTSSQVQTPTSVTTSAAPPRAKVRKPVKANATTGSPTQSAKISTVPVRMQSIANAQLRPASASPTGATLTKVPIPAQQNAVQNHQQNSVNNQPLKTINLAALHTPTPNLPDATLTPLMPQTTVQVSAANIQPAPQPVQVFPAATQLPSPNISITPAPPPQKKEEANSDNTSQNQQTPSQQSNQNSNMNSQSQHSESKSENEKENAKTETTTDDSEEGSGKQKLPKAMVKPQVLTHVIEGFVIQEASEPFPLGRNGDSDEPPLKKVALSGEMGKCEMCGKVDIRSKFKKNKRFCSSQCAKNMKIQNQQSLQAPTQPPSSVPTTPNNVNDKRLKSSKKSAEAGESEYTDETNSSVSEPPMMSPSNDNVDDEPKVNPVKWNVSEVVDFVRSLPGCSDYADDFAIQEIDGQALVLLKEDHLMSAMGMRLGPSLKLIAKINAIMNNGANGESTQNKS